MSGPAERRGLLTFAQEDIWDLHQRSRGAPWQNVYSVVDIEGEIDEAALEHALQGLIRRHEPLRTIYEPAGDGAQAVVMASSPFELERVDLSDGEEVAPLAADLAAHRFVLEHGPLLRAILVRRAERRRTLLVCLDHTCADGWSLQVLARDLAVLYAAATGSGAGPPSLARQCVDCAAWERERAASEKGRAERRWWVERLCEPPVSPVAVSRRLILPVPYVRGSRLVLRVPPAHAQAWEARARALRASLFVLLLAALQSVVERRTGNDDPVIGTRAAARTACSSRLAGAFRNTLVLRAPRRPSKPVERARDCLLAALDRQLTPFPALAADLAERGIDAAAFLRVMLLLDGSAFSGLRLGEAALIERYPVGPLRTPALDEEPAEPAVLGLDRLVARSMDAVTLYVRPEAGGLWLFFFYKTDLMGDDEARNWVEDAIALLVDSVR
jgi:hypothetical protein